ncbi:MAG: ABC transporter transmembrane domain-containing protein, partial [Gemmatimonadales bacterium]
MSTLPQLDDHIIARYTAQPSRLPPELRREIEHAWHGAPVQLYALADLDQRLQLAEGWLVLGSRHVAVARRDGDGWDVRSIDRTRIEAVREAPGLSANTLSILGAPGEPALALVRYTHRQRRAFENIRFVLEEQIQGHARALSNSDADRLYAESVARPIRDAQALVSGHQTAVIRRLLGYLKPYRRQLTFGMAAATVITLVSLVPPYLAGHLIDRVVRPAQAGTLPMARAATIAWLAVAAMGLVYLIRQPAVHVRLRLMSILGEWVARDLRTELYEHIQRLSLSFFSRKRTGSLITRVSADTDRLWDF